jgi:hypothetical protein
MRLYKWNKDTKGTTPKPVAGGLAVIRSGLRHLPWSVCRVVATAKGYDLENVIDLRTVKACKDWIHDH